MNEKISSISLVFENCDSIALNIEDHVTFEMRNVRKRYYGEFYVLKYKTESNPINIFLKTERAKDVIVRFKKSALSKTTAVGTPLSYYIKEKDITNINIEMADGADYYVAVPYAPTVWRPFTQYNLCQTEKNDGDMVELSFSKFNIIGNIPKAIYWWIKWLPKYIGYRINYTIVRLKRYRRK